MQAEAVPAEHEETDCFDDDFVSKECCDTAAYGPSGLLLCFQNSLLSFELCCPAPKLRHRPPFPTAMHVYANPWAIKSLGCESTFDWLHITLQQSLLHGPAYHPRTGHEMADYLPANDTTQSSRYQEDDMNNRLERDKRLRQKIHSRWHLGFRNLLKGAALYYSHGHWSIEILTAISEVTNNFGHALTTCLPGALMVGFLKAESFFDRDLAMARRMTGEMQYLHAKAKRQALLGSSNKGWHSVLALAEERVAMLMEERHAPAYPALVDLVVPLCSPAEIKALAAGLGVIGQLLEATTDPNDGWDPGSWRARSAREHTRLRGPWRHARFRLHVYTICGDVYSTSSRGAGVEVLRPSEAGSAARLSNLLFQGQTQDTRLLFGASKINGLPGIHLGAVDEEVPTGDVVAYLQHLGEAAADGTLANVSLLVHPDFIEHIRPWMLDAVIAPLANGAWPHGQVDFLYLGWRHEGPVQEDGRVASHLRYHCEVIPGHGGKLGTCDRGYNPRLLENMWRIIFGRELQPEAGDDLGGYDFSQLLVSRQAVLQRPANYWRYLVRALSARSSFELLPGTRFVSRKVDLSPTMPWNKGLSVWLEHMWHLLFDRHFFPDSMGMNASRLGSGRDLRSFTHVSNRRLPLGLRAGPDNVMARHYWLTAEEQCAVLEDEQGCRLLRLQRGTVQRGR
eukprot:TRINITY_DN102720_c0_g1_i1.p1 TRINITY_DN102720_c0_g1~~TRINITY_DN102720_c0_g1_i1.p1  ORF type:complete len:679 (-),score=86.89 TRINITY_DN102720_c0_g1_i1:34-2070(-)